MCLRMILVPVSILLLLSLMACTQSEYSHTKSLPQEDEVILKFYFSGDKKSATDEVWEAVSAYVKKKGLNVKFDINFIPYSDYKKKLLIMSAAGDNWDMNFDADWLAVYPMISKGAYLNLNTLLPKYAPSIYKKYKDLNILEDVTVNGAIVALPWTLTQNQRPYFQWRSDLTKQAGIEPPAESIKTIEDADKLVYQIKKAYPDLKIGAVSPVGSYGELGIIATRDELYSLNAQYLVVNLNDPKFKVMAYETTPSFREAVHLAAKWYDDGIINKDVLLDKEALGQKFVNGHALFNFSTHAFVNNTIVFTDPLWTVSSSILYPDKKFVNRSSFANVLAINKNARNPERVLRFLELLETDRTLYYLVINGIEGSTYTMNGTKVDYPTSMTSVTSNYMDWGGQWPFWRLEFIRPNEMYPTAGFWENEAVFARQPGNIVSPLDGLFIADDTFKNEAVKRDQIYNELGVSLENGVVADVDKAVDDYIAKQKAAGLDKIIAEAQKQVDAFLAKERD